MGRRKKAKSESLTTESRVRNGVWEPTDVPADLGYEPGHIGESGYDTETTVTHWTPDPIDAYGQTAGPVSTEPDFEIRERHSVDGDGMPAGGETTVVPTWRSVFDEPVISIKWQDGPLRQRGFRSKPNGAFVEDVIRTAVGRIEFYQRSQFACDENHEAVIHLKAALDALDRRTRDRDERGVEGTHNI